MWTRSFLLAGVLSSIVAAALTVGGLWLALFAAERAGAQFFPASFLKQSMSALQYWMLPGIPGALIYAICWHRVIYRKRDYSWRNTAWLVAVSYLVACLVGGLVMLVFVPFAMLTRPDKPPSLPGTAPWLGFAITFASAELLIVLFYVPMAGALLAVPFLLVAAPVACLQRALLLKAFA
jgi:hypothetical protein